MYTYSLAHFNYFVVTKTATERCFLKMVASNKLIKSLGNTYEGFVFRERCRLLDCGFARNEFLPACFSRILLIFVNVTTLNFGDLGAVAFRGTSLNGFPLLVFIQLYLFGEVSLTNVNSP